ncbi:unnamed protein product, partial [marine sediment metagenome]
MESVIPATRTVIITAAIITGMTSLRFRIGV